MYFGSIDSVYAAQPRCLMSGNQPGYGICKYLYISGGVGRMQRQAPDPLLPR